MGALNIKNALKQANKEKLSIRYKVNIFVFIKNSLELHKYVEILYMMFRKNSFVLNDKKRKSVVLIKQYNCNVNITFF